MGRLTQYYALINKQRPVDQPPLAEVTVPDLHGVFLRGINQLDPLVSKDPRDRENRNAGSYQADGCWTG